MAGAMRKMGVYLGLVEGQDTYADDDLESDRPGERGVDERSAERPDRASGHGGAVTRLDERRRPVVAAEPMSELSRIITLHPRTYNEARTLGETFREGTPVIMNLTEMDDNDAKRLVDFAAGLVFAVHGTIERVTSKVFLLSPANVTVAAEDKQRLAEGGFFNQS